MKKLVLCTALMVVTNVASAAVVDSRSAGPRTANVRPTYMTDGTVVYEEVWLSDNGTDMPVSTPAVVNAKVIGAEARTSSHAAQVAPRTIAPNGRLVLDLNAARTRKH